LIDTKQAGTNTMAWELLIFITATLIISAGCLVPARWLPALPNDKLLHFLAFGGLTLMAQRLANNNSEWQLWLIGLFLLGWLIEELQRWVPGRKFCWRDLAANTAGIFVAASCSHVLMAL
jgi:hypothetical protein